MELTSKGQNFFFHEAKNIFFFEEAVDKEKNNTTYFFSRDMEDKPSSYQEYLKGKPTLVNVKGSAEQSLKRLK